MLSINLDYEEIYPLIFVYHNLLEDHVKLTEIIKNSEKESKGRYYLRDWTPWFVFGTYADEKRNGDEADKTNVMYGNEQYLCQRINEANNSAISHYVGYNNIKLLCSDCKDTVNDLSIFLASVCCISIWKQTECYWECCWSSTSK